jgi:hypothetical protein
MKGIRAYFIFNKEHLRIFHGLITELFWRQDESWASRVDCYRVRVLREPLVEVSQDVLVLSIRCLNHSQMADEMHPRSPFIELMVTIFQRSRKTLY